MKTKAIVSIVVVLVLGLCVAACGNKPCQEAKKETGSSADWLQATGEGPVLAEINGVAIYMDDFKERMERQSPYIRARYNTLEKRQEFLDSMIRFELLAQAAIDRGYHKDPEVLRAAKQVMTQKLMREEFEDKVKRDDISDEQMKTFYEENKDDYNKPAMRRASHILIKVNAEDADKKTWEKALNKAQSVLKEAEASKSDPNSFRQLAAKYSDDASNKNRGGDLGYFAATEQGGPMVKEFSEAVFSMNKINDITGPVKTKFGYHIIRLTGKRDKIERSYEQVKSQIQHRLYKEKRTEAFDTFVENLRKSAKVDVKEQLLKDYDPTAVDDASKAAPVENENENADGGN